MDFRIRTFRPDDVDALYAAVRESVDEVAMWLPWCHPDYTRDDAQQFVSGRQEAADAGSEYSFAVVDTSDRVLGGCGINQVNRIHWFANLGYWVRTSATGRGIASTAIRQVVDYAYRETGLHRIEILCDVHNRASQRAAEKAGAVREGVLRDRLFMHDRPNDAVMFTITRSMWREWSV